MVAFAIAAAADLYRAILTDIEAHDYDVFSRRAHVGGLEQAGAPAAHLAQEPDGFIELAVE